MQEETDHIYRERLDFSKIKSAFPMPDLLAIQKQSYADFLQMDLLPDERKDVGLQAAFKDIFPVSDFKETTQLDLGEIDLLGKRRQQQGKKTETHQGTRGVFW